MTSAIARVVTAAALSALAAWSFRPAFDAEAGLVVTFAVVAPALVVAGWEVLRARVARGRGGAVGSLLALCSALAAVAVVTRPGGDVLSGPVRLLTGLLPTRADGPEVATVGALSALTAMTTVHLASRPGGTLLPTLPALVCLGLGQSLGAAAGDLPVWYGPAFVVLAVPVFFPGTAVAPLRLAKGAAIVVVGAMSCLFFVQFGPESGRSPVSAQELVDAPVRPKQRTNPMAQFLALREGRLVLEVEGTGSTRVEHLGMVTLTDFDGRGWSPSGDYRRAAHQFPVAGEGDAPRRESTLELAVRTPDSLGWLPRPGRPVRIDVAGLGFDEVTGDIVVPAGGRAPDAYRITASEPLVSADLLRTDRPARAAARDRLGLPPDVLAFLDRATAGRVAELDKFLGLFYALRGEPFRHDTSATAPGGHGLYQVSALLRGFRGTSEQYASAFAVLCRELGWDARVVLGFTPRWDGDRLSISGRDVRAWTEVRFERLGWLPVDPTPTTGVSDGGQSPQDTSTPESGPVDLPPANEPEVPVEPDSSSESSVAGGTSSAGQDAGSPWTIVSIAAGVVILLFVLVVPPVNSLVRRRSLRRGSPRKRVISAWRDAVRVLRAAGVDIDDRHTTGQVVEAAHQHEQVLRPLADLVDRAAYGTGHVTDEMAEDAVRLLDSVRALAGLGVGRRALQNLDPRPLVPRRAPAAYLTVRP
ncbi:transglutaminase-like domain-containing protein [Saccharothrix variisporea]|uniref:Uncharacterized protein DUF4129 n=1 Tax=Saccharothrix variisporea TaxID=543527 RepID=A0A495XPT7_9PSEU|nr:transglutaminase-like domain-containing protein [Saccharothrix variisporea]RKT74463.1 uncharacterized protein DUF4129 [Saccharothrix variisporea]